MKVYGHQHSSEVFSRETSPSCFEPKAEKVIAFHGKDASYAYNVLADLKAAGASWGQFGYRKLLYVKVIFYTPGLR
ncbi:hypothetical protein AM455_27545 (plasmid) [Klebsiella pneumoniae]|uniref:hypothetical protein n=1 Tax=Klebsiella pneumoniae TaxID=573 RepID=UPI000E5CE244|nr:hypothetical protein [Klebsiella pneumoniae]AXZ16432.1 hypothetical protein AM455_27545 [Klebsiella pneumoniae]